MTSFSGHLPTEKPESLVLQTSPIDAFTFSHVELFYVYELARNTCVSGKRTSETVIGRRIKNAPYIHSSVTS